MLLKEAGMVVRDEKEDNLQSDTRRKRAPLSVRFFFRFSAEKNSQTIEAAQRSVAW